MPKNKKKTRVIFLGVLAPLVVLVGVLAFYFKTEGFMGGSAFLKNTQADQAYEHALAQYQKLDLEGAEQAIQSFEDAIAQKEEGCELMISILAQLPGRDASLETVSSKCMKLGKAPGITHEGYAKALAAQNRSQEAVAELEAEFAKYGELRIAAALAHLYLFTDKPDRAAETYLEVIKRSDIWSVWLRRAMRFERVVNQQEFLPSAGQLVLNKDKVVPEVEKQLASALHRAGHKSLAEMIEKRISKKEQSSPNS